MFLSEYNILEPIVQTAFSLVGAHQFCKISRCVLHYANDKNESDDIQRSDQKPFASVFLLCTRVPLERKFEWLCSYWKTRRVPVSFQYSRSLKISQTQYLYVSSRV